MCLLTEVDASLRTGASSTFDNIDINPFSDVWESTWTQVHSSQEMVFQKACYSSPEILSQQYDTNYGASRGALGTVTAQDCVVEGIPREARHFQGNQMCARTAAQTPQDCQSWLFVGEHSYEQGPGVASASNFTMDRRVLEDQLNWNSHDLCHNDGCWPERTFQDVYPEFSGNGSMLAPVQADSPCMSEGLPLSLEELDESSPQEQVVKGNDTICPQCSQELPNRASLLQHLQLFHPRPFKCILERYGCKASFGSKNEWKRHIAALHVKSGYWRCNKKPCTVDMHRNKKFYRRDLFIRHARRVHGLRTGSGIGHQPDHKTVEDMVELCYNHIRDLPSRGICEYCCSADTTPTEFHGPDAWFQKLEHISHHFKASGQQDLDCIEDEYLRDWLIAGNVVAPDRTGKLVLRTTVRC